MPGSNLTLLLLVTCQGHPEICECNRNLSSKRKCAYSIFSYGGNIAICLHTHTQIDTHIPPFLFLLATLFHPQHFSMLLPWAKGLAEDLVQNRSPKWDFLKIIHNHSLYTNVCNNNSLGEHHHHHFYHHHSNNDKKNRLTKKEMK